jgi:hypothetical protein
MKKITPNTILKQGDKVFETKKHNGNIYFGHTRKSDSFEMFTVVAQTKPILQGISVISLDRSVERMAEIEYPYYEGSGGVELFERSGFINGFKSNPDKWTDEDMEKAIEMGRNRFYNNTEIFEKLSEISEIEVDNDFNVLNYR